MLHNPGLMPLILNSPRTHPPLTPHSAGIHAALTWHSPGIYPALARHAIDAPRSRSAK